MNKVLIMYYKHVMNMRHLHIFNDMWLAMPGDIWPVCEDCRHKYLIHILYISTCKGGLNPDPTAFDLMQSTSQILFLCHLGNLGLRHLNHVVEIHPYCDQIRSGDVINTVNPSKGFFLKRYTLCEKCVWGQFGLKSIIIGNFLVSSIVSI